jgi:hypothetical protein
VTLEVGFVGGGVGAEVTTKVLKTTFGNEEKIHIYLLLLYITYIFYLQSTPVKLPRKTSILILILF